MKIAFLTPKVPPALEGIGEYTVHLCRALREQGADVQIFTSARQNQEEPWIHAVIKNWNGAECAAALQNFKPDWINLQYSPPLYGRYGFCWQASGIPMELKRKTTAKIAVIFHEFQTAWSREPKKFAAAVILRLQTRRLLMACDAVFSTCESYGAILRKKTSKNVFVIPVGANIEPAACNPAAMRNCYGIKNEKLLAVFGRLSAFRDHKTAVRTLATMRSRGIEAKLLLIGGMRSSSEKLFQELMDLSRQLSVENHLIETGDLKSEEVSAHLQITDLFLFAQADGISTRNTTFLSAMAHGLPVIAYNPAPGNFDGYEVPYGLTVPRGDEKAFIEAAFQKQSGSKELACRYFQTHFSWRHLASRHLDALQSWGGAV